MKGQSQPLIERAVIQARQEADSLYLLVINANTAMLEGKVEREREYIFLLGYLSAEMHGKAPKDRVQRLRLAVLMFLESVITLDAAIAQVAAERLNARRSRTSGRPAERSLDKAPVFSGRIRSNALCP